MRKHILGLLGLLALSSVSDAALYEAGPSGRGKGTDSKPLFAHKGRYDFIDTISESSYAGMHSLRLCAGKYVDSLQLTVRLKNGGTKTFNRHGGRGGSCKTLKFSSGEYITAIYGEHHEVINYLDIYTNKKGRITVGRQGKYEKDGRQKGISKFRYESREGVKIASFFGRSDKYLRALGIIYQNNSVINKDLKLTTRPSGKGEESVVRTSNTTYLGSNRYRYRVHLLTRVDRQYFPKNITNRKITVCSGKYVDSIAIEYIQNGKKSSSLWGGRGGRCRSVSLKDSEYITELSGKHGEVLDSLTIKTNSRVLFNNAGGGGGSSTFRYTGDKNMPIKGFYVRGTRPYVFDSRTGKDNKSKRAKGLIYGVGAMY